ncbi:MAG: UDP-3-O-(3-hydroxymyristoyl)glucosamine N-acyltransferase [Pyrinomonadaceae bacterium]
MDDTSSKTVGVLAALIGGRVSGDEQELIERVASVESAGRREIAFVEDQKLLAAALHSQASCLLVPEGAELDGTAHGPALIETAQPKLAFALIAEVLHPFRRRAAGIHPTAIIHESAMIESNVFIDAHVQIGERAQIGEGTNVFAGAVIGEDVRIGRECVIHPRVVLYPNVSLGERVILHAGVVIGADGFGYVRDAESYHKFPQIGTVVIEDDVEIGAQTCVDRGALGETRIGRGTKIDNLVQIAHNVQIGERVVIAAQTGISGSTVIEDDAVIGGQVGMGDHARVGRGAIIGSKAGVLPGKIVRAGAVVWGVPVRPLDEYKILNAHFGRLPQMKEEIEMLKRQVKELTARLEKSVTGDE